MIAKGFLYKLIQTIKQKISPSRRRYFFIIGSHINYPIGCCTIDGIMSVLEEEPGSRFYEITKEEYENYDEQWFR